MKIKNILSLVIFSCFFAVISQGETIKPVKVTASSELTFYPGHSARVAGDGKVEYDKYWCTDFKNKAKSPHWLIFDFGRPRTFNQIRLYMHPKFERSLMLNDFNLEYWQDGKWRKIVEIKKYVSNYLKARRNTSIENKYSIKVPSDSPVFRFAPVTSSKVRLYITNVSSDVARLHEMVVSLTDSTNSSLQAKSHDKAAALTEGLYCFDFGTKNSATKPGFIKITAETDFSETKEYGWSGKNGKYSCDRTFPDDLKRDFIFSRKPAVFKAKVPDGKYFLYMMSGDTLFATPGVHATVDGRELDIVCNPPKQYDSAIVPVNVESNLLEIKFKAPFLVNALIIAPQKLEKQLTLLTTSFLFDSGYSSYPVKFTRTIEKTNRVKPKVSAQEASQGYICYVPSVQQRVFPDTAPVASQIKETIATGATPGEAQAASFCVYALKPLRNLEIALSALKSASGRVIDKRNIDLRTVKCWPQRSGHKGSSKTWAIIPELLERYNPQSVEKDNSRQFWLTFKVPADTAPGDYQGTIKITAENTPAKELKVKLCVYPFTLKTPSDMVFAMYPGMGSGKTFCSDPRQKAWDLKQLDDMKSHGMNTIVMNINTKYPLKVIIDKIKYCNELLDEAGYPKRPIPWCCRNINRETVIAVRDAVKKNNWREILFYPVDEPFHGTKLKIAQKIYADIKKVNGVRTYSTVYQNSVDKLGQDLDVRCYAVSGASKFNAPRIIKQCKKDGKTFWWYSNGTREYPAVARFKSGLFFWKTQARGQLYWAYMNQRGDALNDFDTASSDHCAVYFKSDEIIPTIQWEGIRQGINDFKYLYTLEDAIRHAPESKKAEVAKAEKLLAEINKKTVIDLEQYRKILGSDLRIHDRSILPPEQYDNYRDAVAAQIVSLKN